MTEQGKNRKVKTLAIISAQNPMGTDGRDLPKYYNDISHERLLRNLKKERFDKIVKETIHKVLNESLNEATPHQKKRNDKDVERFFRNGQKGYNGIHTIVVLTSENPDSQQASNQFNKKARYSLLSNIKDGGYAYVPAMGKFGDNPERPYAVFNMSVDTAKILCGRYQQTSFVFSILKDGIIHSEYCEKEYPELKYNKRTNNYIKKDECDTWEDMSDANDKFTVIGKKFKYSIPFETLNTVNEIICENLNRIVSIERKRGNKSITEEKALDFAINAVGISQHVWRKAVTKGFYKQD